MVHQQSMRMTTLTFTSSAFGSVLPLLFGLDAGSSNETQAAILLTYAIGLLAISATMVGYSGKGITLIAGYLRTHIESRYAGFDYQLALSELRSVQRRSISSRLRNLNQAGASPSIGVYLGFLLVAGVAVGVSLDLDSRGLAVVEGTSIVAVIPISGLILKWSAGWSIAWEKGPGGDDRGSYDVQRQVRDSTEPNGTTST